MNSSVSNTSTPMNPGGNSTSTPMVSEECIATISKYAETCTAEGKGLLTFGSKVPKEIQNCLSANSCTPKQKEDFLKLACPTWNKYSDCMEPAMDCLLEAMSNDARERLTEIVSECDAFLGSSGTANSTTSGNGTSTNTPTSGNGKKDTPVTSAGFSVQGSLIYILAYALLL